MLVIEVCTPNVCKTALHNLQFSLDPALRQVQFRLDLSSHRLAASQIFIGEALHCEFFEQM